MPKKLSHGRSHSHSRSVTMDSDSKSRSPSRSLYTRSEGSNSRSHSYRSCSVSHGRSRTRNRSKSVRSYTKSRSRKRSKDRSQRRSRSQQIPRPRRLKNKLYVGGLKSQITRDQLLESFECYGAIKDVSIGRPGYGFVEFKKERDAECALDQLDGKYMHGSKIHIEFAKAISNTVALAKKKAPKKNSVANTSGPKRSITPLMSRKLRPTLLASSLITSDGNIQPLLPIFKHSSTSPRDNISPRHSKISPLKCKESSRRMDESPKYRKDSPKDVKYSRNKNKSRQTKDSSYHEVDIPYGKDSPKRIIKSSKYEKETSRQEETFRNGRDIGRLSPQRCRHTSRLSPYLQERSLSPRYTQRLSPPPKLTRESPIRHRMKRSVSPLPPPDVFVAKRERAMKLLPAPPSFRDIGEERFYEDESKIFRGHNRSLHLARPPVREISPRYRYSPAHYPLLQPSQFNNQMRRSISHEKYIQRSLSRERFMQRSMSSHRYIHRSISGDQYRQKSVSRKRYISRSISRNRYIYKSKSRNRYINRSISKERKIDRSISRNRYVNRSISRDRNIRRSISKDIYFQRSISHSMRLAPSLDKMIKNMKSPYIKIKSPGNRRSRSISVLRSFSRSISMTRSKRQLSRYSRHSSKNHFNRHIKPPTPPSPSSYNRNRRSLMRYEKNRSTSYKRSRSKVSRPISNVGRSNSRIERSMSNRNSMSQSPSINSKRKFCQSPSHNLRKHSLSYARSESQVQNGHNSRSNSPASSPIKQYKKSQVSLKKYRSPSIKYRSPVSKYKSPSSKYRFPSRKNRSPSINYKSPSEKYVSRLTATKYGSPESFKASINKYASMSPPVLYKSRSIYKSPSKRSTSRLINKSPAKKSRSPSNYRLSTKRSRSGVKKLAVRQESRDRLRSESRDLTCAKLINRKEEAKDRSRPRYLGRTPPSPPVRKSNNHGVHEPGFGRTPPPKFGQTPPRVSHSPPKKKRLTVTQKRVDKRSRSNNKSKKSKSRSIGKNISVSYYTTITGEKVYLTNKSITPTKKGKRNLRQKSVDSSDRSMGRRTPVAYRTKCQSPLRRFSPKHRR